MNSLNDMAKCTRCAKNLWDVSFETISSYDTRSLHRMLNEQSTLAPDEFARDALLSASSTVAGTCDAQHTPGISAYTPMADCQDA